MFRICTLSVVVLCLLTCKSFSEEIGHFRFQGVWKAVKCIESGTAKPDQIGSLMTIKGNRITDGVLVFENRETMELWTLTLNVGAGEKRNNLDFVVTCQTIDAKRGMVVTRTEIPGIYRLESGDGGSEVLVICMGEEGGERPTGFEPKKGQTQWTFKKVR